MNSVVNKELIRLFEKLPVLSLCHISKHLNACAIVMVAAYSKKWEKIMRKRRNKTSVWEIHILKDQINFWIVFTDKAQNFCLNTQPKLMEGEPFSKETQFDSLNYLKKMSRIFPPTSYPIISVSLGTRCSDFPFRLLCHLPRGSAHQIHLQADGEVNGADLVKFLKKVQVKDNCYWVRENRLNIQVGIKHLVTSDKIHLENNNLSIRDARFLTRNSSPKLGAYLVEIGMNNFTSHDLNSFLKSWMVDGKENESGRSLCTIDIGEHQDIKLEEVMEGLDVHVHGQATRDRWHIHFIGRNGSLHAKATDMNGGLDISNSKGKLGTLLLEPHRFTFVTWLSEFTWEIYEKKLRTIIKKYTEEISVEQMTLERLQQPVGRRRYNAGEVQSKINEYREKMKQGKQEMARCCGIYQKLITEWNND